MRANTVQAAPQALLLALLCAAAAAAAAQQAQSRSRGDPDPSFVADAASPEDLAAAGFLSPQDSQAAFGNGSGNATDSFGVATGSRLKYQGAAISSYEQDPIASSGAIALGCGFGYVDEDFTGNYVGVGSSFFSKGFACGRCMRVQCDDRLCEQPGSSITALIVDLCGDCVDADIALAMPGFANLTGKDPSLTPRIQVSWELTDCAPFTTGTIKMLVKPGGNAYFQSFNFANSAQPITAVQLNGERLRHSTSNFWEYNPGKAINPRGPFNLALLGANKQVLRVRFNQLRSQDLKVQFN